MLRVNDVEAELSYAYLHAVASQAGFICSCTCRHLDNAAIDARIDLTDAKLAEDSYLTSVTLDVQLKATCVAPAERDGRFSFGLPVRQYDKLRSVATSHQRLLVILLLPAERNEWLTLSEESLAVKRCAFWTSLRGAPTSANTSEQTVHVPRSQQLTPTSLRAIMTTLSRQDWIDHAP